MAHYYDGAWHIQTLARTTFRQAASEANASSVGLALDRLQALKVAYIDPRRPIRSRLVGEDARPQRFGTVPATAARATIAFGANGEVGAGPRRAGRRGFAPVGRDRPSRRRDADVPLRMGQSVSSAVIAGILARRADRGLPRSPRRVRGRAGSPQVPQRADRARLALQPEQPVQRGVRGGAHEGRRHRRRPGRERRPARVRRNRLLARAGFGAPERRTDAGYATLARPRRRPGRRAARALRGRSPRYRARTSELPGRRASTPHITVSFARSPLDVGATYAVLMGESDASLYHQALRRRAVHGATDIRRSLRLISACLV